MQVAGYVLWPQAAWLYRGAVTHRRLTILRHGGLQIAGMYVFIAQILIT